MKSITIESLERADKDKVLVVDIRLEEVPERYISGGSQPSDGRI